MIDEYFLLLLKYFLLFSLGSMCGWLIELFWRRYRGQARRWINPGFLNGPWLPLYGFGCIVLYLLCLPDWPVFVRAPVFLAVLTLLELAAGAIFIGQYKIRLWDYRENRWNFRGLICPLYSFFWMVLGLAFSYFVYPYLESVVRTLYEYRELSFFIGLYGGLLSADLWQSFNLALRLKGLVHETEERWLVDFEKFKLELRDRVQEGFVNHTRFFLPFHGELGVGLRENLRRHKKNLAPLRKVLEKRGKAD